jgi:hypothetical protein
MEVLNGIFSEVSGNKLESSLTRVIVWFSTLIFPFYKLQFMNRLEFFVRIFKTREEYCFLLNLQEEGTVNSMEQLESFVKLMSMNSTSGFTTALQQGK